MERGGILMSSNLYMTGAKPTGRNRKNVVYGENRVCEEKDCEQIMSKYNHNNKCYQHAPKKIPRVRGNILRS